jgi:outer membrane translocation and assembly module TamA
MFRTVSIASLRAISCGLALAAVLVVCTFPLRAVPSAAQSQQSEQGDSKFVVADLRIDGDVHDIDAVRTRVLTGLEGHEYERHRRSLDGIGAKIQADFEDRGYFKVALDDLRAQPLDSDKHRMLVIVHVVEGEQYRAGNLAIISDEPGRVLAVPEEQLRQQFHLHTGDLFSAHQVRKGVEGLRQLYLARGYLDMTATPEFSIDPKNKLITSTWHVREGNQYHVGSVDVRGLDSRGKALLEAQLLPGSLFDQTTVKQLYDKAKASLGANVAFDSFDDVVSLTPHTDIRVVDVLFDFSSTAPGGN